MARAEMLGHAGALHDMQDAKAGALRSLWFTAVLTALAVAGLSLLIARAITGAVGRVRADMRSRAAPMG